MKETVTLLIPEKTDAEFEAIFACWTQQGGRIQRLGKYWIYDEALANKPIAVYGNQAFAFVLAQIYHLTLIAPDDSLIARLDKRWTKRDIKVASIGNLSKTDFPAFVKPVIPILFLAGIFNNLTDLQAVTQGLLPEEEILIADVVPSITAEARAFILNGDIMDITLYEGDADLSEGTLFLEKFLAEHKQHLPATVVTDIAYCAAVGWFVLEFNACWGAGLNNCHAEKVIDCIITATVKTQP